MITVVYRGVYRLRGMLGRAAWPLAKQLMSNVKSSRDGLINIDLFLDSGNARCQFNQRVNLVKQTA
jgi:hypothetical protein